MGLFDNLFGKGKRNTDFVPSVETMPDDKFWDIIQKTFKNSKGEYEEQQEQLTKEIGNLSLQDIILFDNKFRQLRGQANNWQMWGAIYIIHGGCGDDSFTDFRGWVIAQGKDFYYKTLANPESLVDVEEERIDVDWEGMGYIPTTVFEELTGQDIPSDFVENQETTGDEWSDESDDLKNMFPKLYAKYADNI